MIQVTEKEHVKPIFCHNVAQKGKSTHVLQSERVGEDWPKLLTKKWLAVYFGCWTGQAICRRRFRAHVLTPEVLKRAGIPETVAYSINTKTFDVLQSAALTKVLNSL
jgi:hypothetical protein